MFDTTPCIGHTDNFLDLKIGKPSMFSEISILCTVVSLVSSAVMVLCIPKYI